ncbi:MAG: right-handed parallel beta-helix repeat-containing protein [Thermoplasmata archaeon]|nr:MAG: right-handed parallel beta-helix repeat-containing protein [Thermoplasmata archaeon]
MNNKQISSGIIWLIVLSITLAIVQLNIPIADAYTTPGSGVNWDMDDLVANSGGAVTGASGIYTFHETVIIAGGPSPDTLNINPGDICYFDYGSTIRLEVQGNLNALGGDIGFVFTSNNPTPNSGDWDSIFFNGGIGEIYNCLIEYAGDGITIMDGSVTINKSTITNNLATGIYFNGGTAEIKNSNIFGRNAPSGSSSPGGNGIYCTGTAIDTLTITGSNITGGNGDEFGGSINPIGGTAILCQNFDGKIEIADNFLIKGGNGGDNNLNDGIAGDGGHAIHFYPVANYVFPPAINISGNQNIIGGDGGDNNAVQDGVAGNGGYGINISDDDATGKVLIEGSNRITGGVGGDNHAGYVNGWTAGKGGNGIYISNCSDSPSIYIGHIENVFGGKGGNNSGMGPSMGPIPSAGNGGHGLYILNCSNVKVESINICGGDGGNNTATDDRTMTGNGGCGVFALKCLASNIMTCNIQGGEGGDNYIDGIMGMPKEAGAGGSGIFSDNSLIYAENVNITGGEGGDNYGEYSNGGDGGIGISCLNGLGISANAGTITGGKGGDDYHPNGWERGDGTYAIHILNGLNLEYKNLIIKGGDGGNNYVGTTQLWGGNGGDGIRILNSDSIDIHDNPLITIGKGGIDYVGGNNGGNGFNVINVNENVVNSQIRKNLILSIGDGILVESNILIDDNTIKNIYYEGQGSAVGIDVNQEGGDTIISNNILTGYLYAEAIFCQGQSRPIIVNNTIDTNYLGIYMVAASPYIARTTITNSSYGIYALAHSEPFFENCTITDSDELDFIVRDNSHVITLNTTFDSIKIDVDPGCSLTVKNYLDILVLNATTVPISGADINVTDNGNPIYQTSGFGGSDPKTGIDGFVRWIAVIDRIYIGSSVPTENITNAEVSYPTKTFINNPRDVSMFESHTEIFIEVGGVLLSDLVLISSNIDLSPQSPVKNGTLVTINATITNNGLEHATDIFVRFYDGVPPITEIGEDIIPFIPSLGGIGYAEVEWIATPVGLHKIYVVVDPDDMIPESNETNNIANMTIGVGIPLYNGWNLVSIPYIQWDTNLGSVLDSIEDLYDSLQLYNATDDFDHWKHYHVSKPTNLNDLETIDHTVGLWVHITQPGETIFVFNGTQPTENQNITLYPGWNLVGYPSLTSHNRTDGLNNINFTTDVDAIWTYDSLVQRWKALGNLDYFEIGRGYYIHAKSKCTWEVPL